ncbi:MAG: hypothetical protein WC222_03650 [Parachlamydiales bacterium]|jgi:hypothetical protein
MSFFSNIFSSFNKQDPLPSPPPYIPSLEEIESYEEDLNASASLPCEIDENIALEDTYLYFDDCPSLYFAPSSIASCAKTLTNHPNTVIANRAATFISEMEEFAAAVKAGAGGVDYDVLADQYDQNKVVWVTFEKPGFLIRLDPIQRTVHLINATPSSSNTGDSVQKAKPNAHGRGIVFNGRSKRYSAFKMSAHTYSGQDLMKVLKNANQDSNPDAFLLLAFPSIFGMTEANVMESEAYPERYLESISKSDFLKSFEVAFTYHLQGIFEAEPSFGQEADIILKQAQFKREFQTLKISLKSTANLRSVESKISKCTLLIAMANTLDASGMLEGSDEVFKVLNSMFVDLSKQKETLLNKSVVVSLLFDLTETAMPKVNINLANERGGASINEIDSANAQPVNEASKNPAEMPSVQNITPETEKQLEVLENRNFNEMDTLSVLKQSSEDFRVILDNVKDSVDLLKDTKAEIIPIPLNGNSLLEPLFKNILTKYLPKLIMALPMPNKAGGDFWEEISPEECESYLQLLDEVHDLLHLMDVQENGESRLLNYLLLACIDRLARLDTKSRLNATFPTYDYDIKSLYQDEHFILFDIDLHAKALELILYYDPQYKYHQSFKNVHSYKYFKKAIQKSNFALFSLLDKKIHPLRWDPLGSSEDREGNTYAYYKQFIEDENVQNEWSILGDNAPKTEAEKVLWVAERAVNGHPCLPKSVTAMQKAVVRTINSCYPFLGAETPASPQASVFNQQSGILGGYHKYINVSLHGNTSPVNSVARSITENEFIKWEQTRFYRPPEQSPCPRIKTFASSLQNLVHYPQNKCLPRLQGTSTRDNVVSDLIQSERSQINSNPLDSLNRLVGYFQKNLDTVESFIREITLLFCQFNRLNHHLKCQPRFTARIKKFFVDVAIELLEKKSSKFILWCSLASTISSMVQKIDSNLSDQFPNADVWLEKEILPLCTDIEDKNKVHLAICKLGIFNERSVLYYFLSQNLVKNPLTDEITDEIKDVLLNEFRRDNSEDLKRLVFDILGEIYNISFIGPLAYNEEAGELSCGEYRLDINTFMVKCSNDKFLINVLPQKIFTNSLGDRPKLEKILPGNYQDIYEISQKGFEYELLPKEGTENLNPIHIYYDPQSNIIEIAKVFQGKLHRLMSSFEKSKLELEFPLFKQEKYHCWICHDNSRIVAEATGEKAIHIHTTPIGKDNLQIDKVIQGNLTLWHSRQVPEALKAYFDQFNPSKVYWADSRTGKLSAIKMESSALSFTVGEKDRLYVDQIKGFYIAQSETLPFLDVNVKTIQLINSEGKVKNIFYNRTLNEWVEIDYVNDRWEPKNRLGAIYLIYEYIITSRFADAQELIKSISLICDFDEKEKCMLNALKKLIVALDPSPNKIGLKIQFAILAYDIGVKDPNVFIEYVNYLKKNKYPDLTIAFQDVYRNPVIEVYRAYRNIEAKQAHSFLDTNDEIRVIDIFIAYCKSTLRDYSHFSLEDQFKRMLWSRCLTNLEALKGSLEGASEASVCSLPQTRTFNFNPQAWISPSYFIKLLDILNTNLSLLIRAENTKASKENREWKAPSNIKEELAFLNLTKIDPDAPIKSCDGVFFKYYYYITEIANEQQRQALLLSLELNAHHMSSTERSLIIFLKNLCLNPLYQPSLSTLLSWFRKYENSKSFWNITPLFLLCAGFSCIQFFTSGYEEYLTSIKECYQIASLWFQSSSYAIKFKAFVYPWVRPYHTEKENVYDCSAIDTFYTSIFAKFISESFTAENGSYCLTKDVSISAVIDKAQKTFIGAEQTNKVEFQNLLRMANTAQDNDYKSAALRELGRSHLDSKQLHSLFSHATEEQFMEKTTFKDPKSFAKFLVLVTGNYQIKSRIGQLGSFLTTMKDAQKINLSTSEGKLEYDCLVNEAIKKLLAVPAYTRTTARKERLLIAKEAQMGSLLRTDQYAKILEIEKNKEKEVLYEAPLGYGKTIVIRPVTNALIQTADYHSFNILPRTQELDLSRNLERDAQLSFGTRITRFNVKRNQPLTLIQLSEEYKRLKSKRKQTTTCDPETYQLISIQMDVLSYRYRYTEEKSIPPEILEEIRLCQSILRIVRAKGIGTFEEEDQLINPNYKIIFSLGSLHTYNPAFAEVMRKIIVCLMEDPEWAKAITQNSQENWTDIEIDQKFSVKIIDYFVKEFGFEGRDAELFRTFVLCPEEEKAFEESYHWAEINLFRSKIALIKGVVNVCLKQAKKGSINARNGYALSLLDPNYKVPIPVEAKDQLKETKEGKCQFHPDVALLRAFFYFHARKLTQNEALKMITSTYKKARSLSKGRIPLRDTIAGIQFHKMLAEAGVNVDEFPIASMKSKINRVKLALLLQHNPVAINFFVETIVSEQIQIYGETIDRSTQFMRSMYRSTISLSATPQSKDAHGRSTEFTPVGWAEPGMTETAKGIREMVLNKTGTDSEVRLHVLQSELIDELLAECIEGVIKDNAAGIIEAAPLFSSIPNYEIAVKLREKFKESGITAFKGILLYDEKDKLPKVLDLNTGTLQVLQGSDFREEELFKLYDESAASNTDWKSAVNHLFKVVIGPYSTLEEIGQGMGRARLLHLLQTISYVMRKETHNEHFAGKDKISPQEILDFLLNNSKVANELRVFNALKDQMENELQSPLYDRRIGLSSNKDNWENELNTPPNPLDAIRIVRDNEEALITQNAVDPWEMYSNMRKNNLTVKELENVQTRCIGKIENSKSLSYKERSQYRANVNSYTQKWTGEGSVPLPLTVNGASSSVLAQVEVVRTTEKNTQYSGGMVVVQSNLRYSRDRFDKSLDVFQPGFYKPSAFKRTALRVISFINQRFGEFALVLLASSIIIVGVGSILAIGHNVIRVITVGANFSLLWTTLSYIYRTVMLNLVTIFCCTRMNSMVHIAFKKFKGFEAHYLIDVVSQGINSKVKPVLKMFNTGHYTTNTTQLNVMVSNNKQKFLDEENSSQIPYLLDAKRLKQVLVVRELLPEGKDILTLIDIDMNDSEDIIAELMNDRESTLDVSQRTVQVGIYDVEAEQSEPMARFVNQGKNGIEAEAIIKNPAFHAGMALLKLHNGYVEMLPKELDILTTNMVDQIGLDELQNRQVVDKYLRETVLEQKHEIQENYSNTSLAISLRG